MGYMKYKGYIGSVEYSEEDQCLFGKVQGMSKDCITYEGNDVESLKKDFEGAVDDYLQACEARGVEPRKAYSGMLNVRLTPDIHTKIAIAASEMGTTINGYIRNVLEHQVASVVI
ncbi:MAG: type II toxin-antitoxin system HicB family antitoxin [Prevotella sp.]|nr:type II toxin-antitoxin system HicB family antitoxin [Prevotella sp.]